ncbi:glycoside hydrolase family 127 protein [Microlunatus speluncae]|uniref:glycoside hydrolase family 127 protein n=1 Tax=Microlunatus speluncae TaxID=2594267 RepID=UPI001FEC6181|nr:beta-L-arabinofuranosidase domain-containing protein [Microlunatus speluncae]
MTEGSDKLIMQRCAPVLPSRPTAAHPVDLRAVKVTGGLWADRQRANRTVSFPLGLKRLESEGNFRNLRLAAGAETGDYRLPMFMDGAIHKMLEAAAWEIAREPDPELERFIAETTELLERVQDDDGYLNSYQQAVRPGPRYAQLERSHEIYLAGLLALAGVAADRAGLGDRLLAVGRRFADHLVQRFLGSPSGGADGHPGAELAMIELFRHTGEARYLELARAMIDNRGHGRIGGAHGGLRYLQDHQPVREAASAVGHAVRQHYLDAGTVDLFLETLDRELLDGSVRRWDDLVATKLSITGGTGSRHRGEAFGDGYELPPDRAYNESCAAFAAVFWNWRLLLATGESRYADLIERLLYNAFAASTSVDGSRFFYVNPLQRREDHFEADDDGRRHEWFDCPCCPPNIMRLVSSLGGYLVTTGDDEITLQQFMPSELTLDLPAGRVILDVATDFPWQGTVVITVREAPDAPITLGLRRPGWAGPDAVRWRVADEEQDDDHEAGYLRHRRTWLAGDVITLELDLTPRLVAAHHRVDALRGCVAVERGPLVYCFEQRDQATDAPLPDTFVDSATGLREVTRDLPGLGSTVLVELDAVVATPPGKPGTLPYGPPGAPVAERRVTATALPYFLWDNRGPGGMRVWLPGWVG